MSAVIRPLERSLRDDPGGDTQRGRRGHLEVVRAPRRQHPLLFTLLAITVLAGAVFGTLALNALAAADSVAVRELEQRRAEAERTHADLLAEVAALEDPARVREAALELGMVPGGAGRHIELDRSLPADGAVDPAEELGTTTDPLKPLLSRAPR